MHRDIFAGRHRHGAGDQPGDAGDQDAVVARAGRGHPSTRLAVDDAVVGAQYGGAEPADTVGTVAFMVASE
jgi:uncharacterized protein YjlB